MELDVVICVVEFRPDELKLDFVEVVGPSEEGETLLEVICVLDVGLDKVGILLSEDLLTGSDIITGEVETVDREVLEGDAEADTRLEAVERGEETDEEGNLLSGDFRTGSDMTKGDVEVERLRLEL